MRIPRTFTVSALSLVLVTSAIGCSQNESVSNSGKSPESAVKTASGKKVEITFSNWLSVEEASKDIYAKMIEEFQKKNPDITVKSIGIPFNQYKDQVLVSSAGGNAPDVIQSNQTYTSAFVGAQIGEQMEKLLGNDMVNDILDSSKGGVTFDGKLMAMPWITHPNALFWNKSLFKQAGLDPEKGPKTWEEMLQAAEKIADLKKNEKGSPIYGFAAPNNNLSFSGQTLLLLNYTYGGNFINDKGELVFGQGDSLTNSLLFYQSMTNKKIMPKGVEIKDVRGMFANGALGMMLDGDFGRSTFRVLSGKGEAFDKEWGVTTVPVNKTGKSETTFTEHQLLISKNSTKKEAAAELVKFLVSKDAMVMYHKAKDVMSSRKSIAADPNMNEDEYMKVFNKQMTTATSLPAGNPSFDNAMKEVASMIVLVTEGNEKPEFAISKMMPKIKDMYKK